MTGDAKAVRAQKNNKQKKERKEQEKVSVVFMPFRRNLSEDSGL